LNILQNRPVVSLGEITQYLNYTVS